MGLLDLRRGGGLAVTDEAAASASNTDGEDERNHLRIAWENLAPEPTTNAERAFQGWRILRKADGVELLAVHETGELYACHDGIWEADGEQVLRRCANQMMTSEYSTTVLRELKDRVRATSSVPWSEMGTPNRTVTVENGLLDVESRTLRDLRPEDRALHRLPVEYDPSARCPRWKEFLEQVTDGEAARRKLQEFVGYCLAGGEPWLKKALMIFGPTDAGKTVFLEVVERLFGEEANAAQTPQYLANQRWGVHQLAGKPVNIRHDIDADRIQKPGIIKEIVDGNAVTAEQKGKDPYRFKPTTRLLFAANRAPKRTRDDEAFWNRWLTVVFPESIPPEEQADKTELLAELTDELPGVLNWALDGLDRLRETGGFTEPKSPVEVRRVWEQYGGPVERFKAARLVKDPGAAVEKDRVSVEFTKFCIENDFEDLTDQTLTRELTKDPAIGQGQRRIGDERPRVYTGVRLKGDGEAALPEAVEEDLGLRW